LAYADLAWHTRSFSTNSLKSDSAAIGVLYFASFATLFHLFKNSIDGATTMESCRFAGVELIGRGKRESSKGNWRRCSTNSMVFDLPRKL